jgi:hypothetical protein
MRPETAGSPGPVPAADPSYHIVVVHIKIQEDEMAQINDTRGRTAEPSRYNFTILLGNGSFVDLANQLSNPQVVLPFLYSVLGSPLAFAGLIVPMNNIGGLFGRAITAPLLATLGSANGTWLLDRWQWGFPWWL